MVTLELEGFLTFWGLLANSIEFLIYIFMGNIVQINSNNQIE